MSRLDDVIYQAEHALLEAEDRMVTHRRRFPATSPGNARILALFEAHLSIAAEGVRALERVRQVRVRVWKTGPRLAYVAALAAPAVEPRDDGVPLRVVHRANEVGAPRP